MNDFKYICIQIFPVFLKFEIYTAFPLNIITFSNKKRGSVVGLVSVFVNLAYVFSYSIIGFSALYGSNCVQNIKKLCS